ncbi:putative serine protease 47 [Ochlerotatus camptorhynchus]|uniref:putative serine protease 47 n=1 Tax=Ochlerotatus camptorhynchus TaxID=644619 RepID=UPI0031D5B355
MIVLTWLLAFGLVQIYPLGASYQCGIRKHSFVPRMHRGWAAEEGQWPWHGALFHKTQTDSHEYACGATLLNQKHVLTSAHCVINRNSHYPLPANRFELHFGQQNIAKMNGHVQVRKVSDVHVHPEHSTHKNDVAMLVMKFPVQYTDFVIPICMDQRADSDLRNLEGQRGWITGWGTTESGVISDVLKTASMPVVGYLQCFNDDQILFGNLLNRNVFCAGERNGTSPGTGDSGGGMYFSEGDSWVLKGIISFAKADEMRNEVDTSKFAVFVNVQRFLPWIKQIMSPTVERPKRTSERECDRFQRLTKKRRIGSCANARYPHTVTLLYPDGEAKCAGVLVNENHVLTACHCEHFNSSTQIQRPTKVQIDAYGIVGISKITCHPQYKTKYLYHDLAVVKLNSAVELSSNLIPACLANNWTENLYDTLLQTGYGKSLFTGVKKFIDSDENQIITKEQCDQLSTTSKIAPNGTISAQLCVINSDRLRISNVALPGTPLQSVNSRTCLYTVVGVTSSANFGPNLTTIDVYSRVSHHLDWIEEIVWNVKPPMAATVGRRRRVTL